MPNANMLHYTGVSIVIVSITARIGESLVMSNRLIEPTWLWTLSRIAAYALWIGVAVVFSGIIIQDRAGKRH